MVANAEERCQKLQKELEDFAYIVSHDFNAPMRHIREFSKILVNRLGDKVGEQEKQYVQILEESVKRSESMLGGLLELSRLNTRAEEFEEVNLQIIVQHAKESLARVMNGSNASIEIKSMPVTQGDASQLKKLFFILLDNALKYHEGSVEPKVLVSAQKLDGVWHVFVQDNGPGIAQEQCEKIFRLFYRANPQCDIRGSGAGLTIASKIAERHGFELSCKERLDGQKGACFMLRLSNE